MEPKHPQPGTEFTINHLPSTPDQPPIYCSHRDQLHNIRVAACQGEVAAADTSKAFLPDGVAVPGLLGFRSRTVWPVASKLFLVSSRARFMAGVGMV